MLTIPHFLVSILEAYITFESMSIPTAVENNYSILYTELLLLLYVSIDVKIAMSRVIYR